MSDLVGRTLGAYRIESRLGVGGMGEVYRAVHERLNRPAAIKVLHANQAADPTFQARFLREARAAAALSHPNIVEVFDFGEQDDISFLVMELVPDGSLRTLLRQRSAEQGWSLGLGVDLVRQAAEGLAYAHARGMVHRDIKPDNLLLQRIDSQGTGALGERYQLKISDFGLARLVEDGGELTATGMVMGTPTYMSPEQCQGETLDGRSDLYSLGVVLYEVATGAPPFRVKSLSEAVFKHISTPPTPPQMMRPDLPLALDEVIMRCLEKRPENRFATGTELAEALEGALGDTELRTIITVQGVVTPSAPPTPALVNSTAPTVADSTPGRAAATPPTPAPVVASAPAMSDDATVSASVAPTPVASASARPAAMPWPKPGADGTKTSGAGWPPSSFDDVKALLAQPRVMGIGGGAVIALIALVIFLTSLGGHGAAAVKHSTPAARTTVAPTVSPTPVENIAFQDSLNASSRKWPASGHSFYSDGGYELTGSWTSFTPAGNLGNGSISVRMRQLSGANNQFYGVIFRATNDSIPTGYFFGIAQNQQWTFATLTQGNSTPILAPTTNAAINSAPGASNTITVRATGNHFVFYINGTQVGQADATAFASGRIGLSSTDSSLRVVFNDFVVKVPA